VEFDSALRLNPQNRFAHFLRGNAYSNLKQYQKAINDYNKSIELNSNDATSYLNRGRAKLQLGDKSGCYDLSKAGELGEEAAYDYIRVSCNN